MNNMIYSTQNPEVVASKIEEILRKDLDLQKTMPYSIEQTGVKKGAAASIAADAARMLFGGYGTSLFEVKFDLTIPRAASVSFNVQRHGLACFVGPIMFTTTLNKAVRSEVCLDDPKIFGTPRFKGQEDACARLNKNKDLLKMADKFSRIKSNVSGGGTIKRHFAVIPAARGSDFVVITLPHLTGLTSATTDGKNFFLLADMIEKAL